MSAIIHKEKRFLPARDNIDILGAILSFLSTADPDPSGPGENL